MGDEQTPPFFMVEWTNDALAKEFRPGGHELPKAIKDLGIQYLLINFQNLDKSLSADDLQHAIVNWLPELKGTSLKRIAILVPKKIIGQIAVRNIFLGNDPRELQISFFDDMRSVR